MSIVQKLTEGIVNRDMKAEGQALPPPKCHKAAPCTGQKLGLTQHAAASRQVGPCR